MKLVGKVLARFAEDKPLYIGFATEQGRESVLPAASFLPPAWRAEPSMVLSSAFKIVTKRVADSVAFPAMTIAKLDKIPPRAFVDLDGEEYGEKHAYWRNYPDAFPITFFAEGELEQLATHYATAEQQEQFRGFVRTRVRLLRDSQGIADEIMYDDALLRATYAIRHYAYLNSTKQHIMDEWFGNAGVPEGERERCFAFLRQYELLNQTCFGEDPASQGYRHIVDGRPWLPGLSPLLDLLISKNLTGTLEAVSYIKDRRMRH